MTETMTATQVHCPIDAVPPTLAERRGCAPKTYRDTPGCEVHGPIRVLFTCAAHGFRTNSAFETELHLLEHS